MPVGDDKSALRPDPNMEGSALHSDRVTRRRQIKELKPSPLTVMLVKMRFEFATARAQAAKGTAADQSIIRKALDSAHAAAKDCAPYVHQRLSSLDKSTWRMNYSKLSDDELDTLERLLEKVENKNISSIDSSSSH